ncbi:hypothetical protein QYM36_006596 [Artemia franciscana]|uniref:Uncharacterized protein n=1 Tax=Artemia franciscana TaxID=6661 RepID=A0AA88I9R1_ARTSF|nr:hypothetical protein QYM36_006596 [Artemia franciscana]
MGSFQSTPRYINADAQDDSLILDPKTTFENLKLMYRKELEGRPPLIERKFVSVCNSSGTKDKNSFRILQWNILAQGTIIFYVVNLLIYVEYIGLPLMKRCLREDIREYIGHPKMDRGLREDVRELGTLWQ